MISDADRQRAVEIALDALKTIQALARAGSDKAQDALQTICAIIESLQDGLAGRTTPDVVAAELRALMNDVNDQFDVGGEA